MLKVGEQTQKNTQKANSSGPIILRYIILTIMLAKGPPLLCQSRFDQPIGSGLDVANTENHTLVVAHTEIPEQVVVVGISLVEWTRKFDSVIDLKKVKKVKT